MVYHESADVLLTSTYRNDQGHLCSKLYIKNSNPKLPTTWDAEVFRRAWERVNNDVSLMLLVKSKGRDSGSTIRQEYGVSCWDVLRRVDMVTKVTDEIAKTLGDSKIPRDVMERLIVYTDYLRGPIDAKLAKKVNDQETKREEDGARTWPICGW